MTNAKQVPAQYQFPEIAAQLRTLASLIGTRNGYGDLTAFRKASGAAYEQLAAEVTFELVGVAEAHLNFARSVARAFDAFESDDILLRTVTPAMLCNMFAIIEGVLGSDTCVAYLEAKNADEQQPIEGDFEEACALYNETLARNSAD